MQMYAAARIAFDPSTSRVISQEKFNSVYKELVSKWQVFRSSVAIQPWDSSRVFEVISTKCSEFSMSRMSLRTISVTGTHEALLRSLLSFDGIKPNKGYPVMTVSKFLHFFNPSLFPIYDSKIVEMRVFGRFRNDYKSFCAKYGMNPARRDVVLLHNYVLWAAETIVSAHPAFMQQFVDWLKHELPPREFEAGENLDQLFATAFEFTAIGAAFDDTCPPV